MARISGVDLPRTKRIEVGLTYIFGIGRHRSNVILTAAGVSPDVRVKDLTEDDVRKITRVLEEQGGVEGDLRKEISMNIKRLIEIGSYRGGRHRRNLPLRGTAHQDQRAHAEGPAQGRGRQEEDGVIDYGQSRNYRTQQRHLARKRRPRKRRRSRSAARSASCTTASCTCRRRSTTR